MQLLYQPLLSSYFSYLVSFITTFVACMLFSKACRAGLWHENPQWSWSARSSTIWFSFQNLPSTGFRNWCLSTRSSIELTPSLVFGMLRNSKGHLRWKINGRRESVLLRPKRCAAGGHAGRCHAPLEKVGKDESLMLSFWPRREDDASVVVRGEMAFLSIETHLFEARQISYFTA